MALLDSIRMARDIGLSVLGMLGLNKFRTFYVCKTYDKEITSTDESPILISTVETELLNDNAQPAYVREISSKNLVGAVVGLQEIEIVLSKQFNISSISKIGGFLESSFSPTTVDNKQEFYVRLLDVENNTNFYYNIKSVEANYISKLILKCERRANL